MTDELFNPGFSTADAERPSLEYRAGELLLRFVDWQERPITAVFDEVVAFQWSDEHSEEERWDDHSYIVRGSPSLSQYRREGIATAEHKHFKLCFNQHGILEVLALTVSVRS